MTEEKHTFTIGDHVEKVGGDYTFVGRVVAAFPKISGAERFVVEDDRGVLHVYSAKNLRAVPVTVPNSPSDQYAVGFLHGQHAVWALHKAQTAELREALENVDLMLCAQGVGPEKNTRKTIRDALVASKGEA